jgi:hypothetical protein
MFLKRFRTKTIINFFHRQNIIPTKELLQFIKERYIALKRKHITETFILSTLRSYLKLTKDQPISSLLRTRQSQRPTVVQLPPKRFKNMQPPPRVNPIKQYTRKKQIVCKATYPDGSALSAQDVEGIKPVRNYYERLSLTPVKIKQNSQDGCQAESVDGTDQFRRVMTYSKEKLNFVLWVKNTPPPRQAKGKRALTPDQVHFQPPTQNVPSKSKTRLKLKGSNAKKKLFDNKENIPPKPSFYDPETKKGTTDIIEFTPTKEKVLARINVKRTCSQKDVTKISAREIFEKHGPLLDNEGNLIDEKTLKLLLQLAHHEGWLLGGDQVIDNIAPTTGASNFYTLCLFEDPTKQLLLRKEDPTYAVTVVEEMRHHPQLGLPEKSYYRLFNKKSVVGFDFYPMSYKKPTLIEHELARILIDMGDQEEEKEEPPFTPLLT